MRSTSLPSSTWMRPWSRWKPSGRPSMIERDDLAVDDERPAGRRAECRRAPRQLMGTAIVFSLPRRDHSRADVAASSWRHLGDGANAVVLGLEDEGLAGQGRVGERGQHRPQAARLLAPNHRRFSQGRLPSIRRLTTRVRAGGGCPFPRIRPNLRILCNRLPTSSTKWPLLINTLSKAAGLDARGSVCRKCACFVCLEHCRAWTPDAAQASASGGAFPCRAIRTGCEKTDNQGASGPGRRSQSSGRTPDFPDPAKRSTTMAARPTWKGFLKISLVNIPVRVFPATDSAATISFNQLHAECQTRIQQKRWCPKCEREVPHLRDFEGLRVRKRPLRRDDRRRHGEGAARVDARHRSRAVHRRRRDRSDLHRASVLPRAGRARWRRKPSR